ncbi:MAG: hypothetical protein ACRCUY_13410 [Thermoguttaceae bacterium]
MAFPNPVGVVFVGNKPANLRWRLAKLTSGTCQTWTRILHCKKSKTMNGCHFSCY